MLAKPGIRSLGARLQQWFTIPDGLAIGDGNLPRGGVSKETGAHAEGPFPDATG